MMRKLGMTTMLALVLAAVAVSTAGARHSGTTISGRGVRSLRRWWRSGCRRLARPTAISCSTARSARARGSRRSRRARSTSARVMRRSALISSRPVMVVSRFRGRWAGRRSCTTCPASRTCCTWTGRRWPTSSGQDHHLERSGDRGAEQGRVASVHEDHDRAPLGRVGHDLQPHRLPLQCQRGLEFAGG